MFKKILYLLLGILLGMVVVLTIDQALAFGFQHEPKNQNGFQIVLNNQNSPLVYANIQGYQQTLKDLGSPYWNVDIKGSCEQAEITWNQCKLLIGIAGAESGHGTNFVKTIKGKGRVKDVIGGQARFNPVGMKSPSSRPKQPIPDCSPDGCWWISKFESWEDFWSWYPQHMAKTYLKNGASTPEVLVRRYVGVYSQSWINRVYASMKDL